MAITYVGTSAVASGTGALSVAAVSGVVSGDVILMTVHSANQTISTPSGYTQVANSPQSTGTAASAGGVRCAVFYRVMGGADSVTTVADSGSVTVAVKTAYRGVDNAAPINATAGSTQAATTAMSWPGVTTTAANCMIVLSCAQDTDAASTATSGALTNANLTSITERADTTVTSSVGGGVVVNTGLKATASATGNSTSTGSTSVTHAYVTVALKEYVAPPNINGTVTVTETADTHVATAITVYPTILGVVAATELTDYSVATASVAISGQVVATETADSHIANASVPVIPPVYHIDYDNGNDSNDGLSWGSALKTFDPIGFTKVKPFPAGSSVKLARTQAPLVDENFTITRNRGTLSTYVLDSVDMSTSSLAQYMPKVIAPFTATAGWTARASRTVALTTPTGTRAWAPQHLTFNASTVSTLSLKEFWYTCPATLNLSTYAAIEVRMSVVQSAAITSPSTYTLRLCSDTAGDVALLSIPIVNWATESGILTYEGTLPDGVNSIAVYHGGSLPALRTNFIIQAMIATKHVQSHVNYIGLRTAVRLGADESSYWAYTGDFTNGGMTIRFPYVRVPSMEWDNLPLKVYIRRTVGWARYHYVSGDTGYYTAQGHNSSYGYSLNDAQYRTGLFDFRVLAGTESQPLQILGGYDTVNDVQVSSTALNSCGISAAQISSFFMRTHDTSYVSMRNLDLIGDGDHFISLPRTPAIPHHFTFTDCGFYSPASTLHFGAVFGAFNNGSSESSVKDVTFTRCHGQILPNLNNLAINYLQNFQMGFVLDNCVCTPVVPFAPSTARGRHTTAKIINGLSVYCSASATGGVSATVCDIPPMELGSSGDINVYGTGSIRITVGNSDGSPVNMGTLYSEGCEFCFYSNPYYCYDPATRTLGTFPAYLRFANVTQKFTSGTYGYLNRVPGVLLRLESDTSYKTNVPMVIDSWNVVGDNLQPATLITEGQGGFECKSFTAPAGKPIYIATLATNSRLTPAPHIFRNMTTGTGNLLTNPRGHYVFDNISTTATAASNPNGIIPFGGSYLFRNSTMAYTAAPYEALMAATSAIPARPGNADHITRRLGGTITTIGGADTISVDHLNSTYYQQPSNQWHSKSRINYTRIEGSTHKKYLSSSVIEKDTSTFTTGPSSWKSTLKISSSYPQGHPTILANVPLQAGSTVTITLSLRRSTLTNNNIALLVEAGKTAGLTAADCAPKFAYHTGVANVWQQVTITYPVLKSGMCLISVAHWGVAGGIAWYDTLKVVET